MESRSTPQVSPTLSFFGFITSFLLEEIAQQQQIKLDIPGEQLHEYLISSALDSNTNSTEMKENYLGSNATDRNNSLSILNINEKNFNSSRYIDPKQVFFRPKRCRGICAMLLITRFNF